MKKVILFLKKEFVLAAAVLLAAVSVLFVPISDKYADYIDFQVLAVLFCLMAVVAGFIKHGLFDLFSSAIALKKSGLRSAAFILVSLCFLSSMLITNDVALISFVPLTLALLGNASHKKLIFVIVMETVAANLGSMLTPIGNPQNLYIYSYYSMSIQEFFKIVFPVCVFNFLLIGFIMLFLKDEPLSKTENREKVKLCKKQLCLYGLLFILCLLTVLHFIDYKICFAVCIAALLMFDRCVFLKIDYALLATFAAFFIFVGNVGSIPSVKLYLSSLLSGREFAVSIAASQVISNVPAAIMLSGFTQNVKELLLGVNIGGLGTLIASLASLISYKLYAKQRNAKPLLFLGIFTLINAAVLLVNILFAQLLL